MKAAPTYIFEGGLFSLISHTASILVRFYLPLWLIAMVFAFPTFLLSDLIDALENESLAFVSLAIFVIAVYFASFVIVGEVSEICLGGTASLSKALIRTSIKGVVRLLGTDILVWLCIGFVVVLGAVALAMLNALLKGHKIMLFITPVVFTLLFVVTLAAFLFTAQVVVIERMYWFSALKRSFFLVLSSKGRAFVVALVLIMITLVSWALIFSVPYSDQMLHGNLPVIRETLPRNILVSFLYTIYLPIPNTFLTLAYYYLRRTSETLSISELADIKAYESG